MPSAGSSESEAKSLSKSSSDSELTVDAFVWSAGEADGVIGPGLNDIGCAVDVDEGGVHGATMDGAAVEDMDVDGAVAEDLGGAEVESAHGTAVEDIDGAAMEAYGGVVRLWGMVGAEEEAGRLSCEVLEGDGSAEVWVDGTV